MIDPDSSPGITGPIISRKVRLPKSKNPTQKPKQRMHVKSLLKKGAFTKTQFLIGSRRDPFTIPDVMLHPVNNKNINISILIEII
jgi:hypothetical protein